jgi:MoaA/NifB/PqqE/SkfB family radical SAM enzyme
MLKEVHFLLTYQCNFECDHCFLYCSPYSEGTFTIQQVDDLLREAKALGTVETIYFEGGEPTLYYPLLVESIRRASNLGFQVGIVSNAYGALTEKDAEIWIQPLVEAGLNVLSVSEDDFHYQNPEKAPPVYARIAAERYQLNAFPICIEPPEVIQDPDPTKKGQSLIEGGAKFRGRAADTLAKGLPTRPWTEMIECPYEDLVIPSRVHVDPMGFIHICQGISIGNFLNESFSTIINSYQPQEHPICGPLIRGGPAGLIKELEITPAPEFVDECQACFLTRRELTSIYPDELAPLQVYGLD